MSSIFPGSISHVPPPQSPSSRCDVFSLLMTAVIFAPALRAFLVGMVVGAARLPHRFHFLALKSPALV